MAETVPSGPPALRLDPADNVAVAVRPLAAGEELVVDGCRVIVGQPVGFGHKLALSAIAEGAVVRKYDEVIGLASVSISPGDHVHVHNVVSARLPGLGRDR